MEIHIEPSHEPAEQVNIPAVDRGWSRKLAILIYSTSSFAGTSLALGYALRREWVYAITALLLIGWSALIEPSTVAARRRPGHSAKAKPLTRVSTMLVRMVANTADVVFGGFALLVAWGLMRSVSAPLMVMALSAALASWDLHYFRGRLAAVTHVEAPALMLSTHLFRLALVVVGGSGLGLLALFVRVRYGMGIVVLLSVLALVGLSRAIAYVRRASD